MACNFTCLFQLIFYQSRQNQVRDPTQISFINVRDNSIQLTWKAAELFARASALFRGYEEKEEGQELEKENYGQFVRACIHPVGTSVSSRTYNLQPAANMDTSTNSCPCKFARDQCVVRMMLYKKSMQSVKQVLCQAVYMKKVECFEVTILIASDE
eukprot:TRINITY_DN8432_c0_g1_i8.p2 TRINITY_DN8432_c0_g1~~TRINITY_DN8432_c0_g1_i8.p2  ORF type:complete len:156 (+),score=18.58 TRINITY_DN8432_c0_g1_i8:60-527(+)